MQVSVESEMALRRGLLDLAFDASRLRFVRVEPGGLLAAADKNAALRASAPEGSGRMSLIFSASGDVRGTGELARITFQVTAPGTPTLRLEAVSFTNSAGQVVQARLPPPLSLSPAR